MRSFRQAAWTACLVAACASEEPGIAPPLDALYFPVALAPDPAGRYLYVAGGNADLRYNGGTVAVVDLCRVRALRGAVPGGCPDGTPEAAAALDPTDPAVPYHEEAGVIAAAVAVGHFAGRVIVRETGADRRRLYVTVRSPRALTWIDVDLSDPGRVRLLCGQQAGGPERCASTHRLELREQRLTGDMVRVPPEPYGLSAIERPGGGWLLLVTHLSDGVLSVVEDAGEPRWATSSEDLFGRDRGAFESAALPRAPLGDAGGGIGPVYVTSRQSGLVATAFLARDADAGWAVQPGPGFQVGGVTGGSDMRGIAFSPEGDRAFVVSRSPPALVEVDTRLDPETGQPRNRATRVAEVCAEPAVVRVRPDPATGDLVAYVVCFAVGQVFAVDAGRMQVVDVIRTGRGPATIEFHPPGAAPERAFVAHFGENTIGVIDLDPTSPTYHRLVRRLGAPEPLR